MMLTATKKADDLGNRENVNVRDGNDITYAVDNLTNRYTSVAEANLTYNAAGNLTKDRQGYEYEYDYENRIVKITRAGQTKAEFAYDALGRRIEKKDLVDPNNTRRYYYNYNWQALCQYDGNGAIKEIFVYGNYIDEVLYKVPFFFYIHDHLYSPAALTYWTGNVLERYEYDGYGEPYILDAQYAPRAKSLYGNPYLFTGRSVDILDSGSLKIQYNRNRYYDYYTGRWLTHDPLNYIETMNLYAYAIDMPTQRVDPFGLWGFHCGKDKCKPEDIDHSILDSFIVVTGVHPITGEGTPITETVSSTLLAIDIGTVAEIVVMWQMGGPPAAIVAKAAKLGVDEWIVFKIKQKFHEIIKERDGNDLWLKIEIKKCMKKYWGPLWLCWKYDWNKETKYYKCYDGSFPDGESGWYTDPEHAADNIDACKDTFNEEFDMVKGGLKDLKELF